MLSCEQIHIDQLFFKIFFMSPLSNLVNEGLFLFRMVTAVINFVYTALWPNSRTRSK